MSKREIAENPIKPYIISSGEHIATDFPEQRLLQVNSCGSEHIVKHEYTILRPHGRSDYHFLYLKSGWLDLENGTIKARLYKGQCAVFLPDTLQKYAFTVEGDPVSLFLHFTGAAAAEAMQHVAPNDTMIYTIPEPTVFEGLFKRIYQLHNLKMPLYIPEENNILMQLITILIRSSVPNQLPVRSDILRALEYLQTHFQDIDPLETYMQRISLSQSRFSHLFTQIAGVSPHQYLLKLRLERARGLLRDSTMRISAIAESVCITDPYYFSRIFRKTYGISPREYRLSMQKKGG